MNIDGFSPNLIGICIDIVEIWLGITIMQISSIFDSSLLGMCLIFCFRRIT